MKHLSSILALPIAIFLAGCSTHYSVSDHGHRHHRSHVSVGVHGHSHGRGGEVLGALIIGGIIGHALSEANEQDEREKVRGRNSADNDELVNGYPLKNTRKSGGVQPEKNSEQNRSYQLGQDGNCYLMEQKDKDVEIVAAVPKFSCQ